MTVPAVYWHNTLSDCKFICEAADAAVGHTDELVQHHARHVALGQVGDGSSLPELDVIEAEVGEGGVDDVVMTQHHTLGVAGGARSVAHHAALVDRHGGQPLLQTCLSLILS